MQGGAHGGNLSLLNYVSSRKLERAVYTNFKIAIAMTGQIRITDISADSLTVYELISVHYEGSTWILRLAY